MVRMMPRAATRNDGWRVGAEERRGDWWGIWTEQMVGGICLLEALLFYTT